LDPNNAKLYHAKGLAFQFEALKLGEKVDRDLRMEDELVSNAINLFGNALNCDESFISSMYH
jgi:hypothetical protein